MYLLPVSIIFHQYIGRGGYLEAKAADDVVVDSSNLYTTGRVLFQGENKEEGEVAAEGSKNFCR